MPRTLTPVEEAEAAWYEGQKPAPAVALRYTGAGADVAGAPHRDLTPEETARYLTKSAYHSGLDAGVYTRADEAPTKPRKGSPPPPAEQEPS